MATYTVDVNLGLPSVASCTAQPLRPLRSEGVRLHCACSANHGQPIAISPFRASTVQRLLYPVCFFVCALHAYPGLQFCIAERIMYQAMNEGEG